MTALKDIIFETDQYWVKRVPKGFEVYKIGLTHSTRVAVIGYTGDKGLQRAKLEIERREAASGPSEQRHATKKSPAQLQREIDEVLAKPVASSLKIRLPPGEPAAWAHRHLSEANTPNELAEIWRVMRKPWTGMGVYYASRTGIAQSEIDSVYQQHRARLGAS